MATGQFTRMDVGQSPDLGQAATGESVRALAVADRDGDGDLDIVVAYSSDYAYSGHLRSYDNGGTAWAHWWDYGYVQDFDGGSIGQCAIFDTGHRVAMGFWQTYLQGGNHSYLRFPTTDEYGYGAGTRQDFQGGYMTWDPTNGVIVH